MLIYMLSCLSNSYSLGKYNKPIVGLSFTPFTFTYSTPKSTNLIFTNSNDQSPFNTLATATTNIVTASSSFNPVKLSNESFTIYIKHKHQASAPLTASGGACVLNWENATNLIRFYREPNSDNMTMRIVDNSVVRHFVGYNVTSGALAGKGRQYIHYFISVKGTSGNRTMKYRCYDSTALLMYDSDDHASSLTGIPLSDTFGTGFAQSDLKMNKNVLDTLTTISTYQISRFYNRVLTTAECLAVVNVSPN